VERRFHAEDSTPAEKSDNPHRWFFAPESGAAGGRARFRQCGIAEPGRREYYRAMSFSRDDVESVIRRRLEPLFSLDGGSVSVVDVDAGRGDVVVSFAGSYRACPCRKVILERVLEPTLREELPGVTHVRMG